MMLHTLFLLHQPGELGLLGLELLERGHLVFELSDDERGAPSKKVLGYVDVGKNMITDVEDLLA